MNDTRYIKWNANKKYMLDLQAEGVCMPRTVAMDCSDVALSTSPFGQGPHEPGDMTGQMAVVKPQVGCSALGVCKIIIGEESPVLGPVLLQEFIPDVSKGELSLIFFDGRFSHCVRKMPKAGEWRTNWKFGGRSQAERHPPTAALVFSQLFCHL
jgi:glutathione synthase/RimK-type ligase-like ATP-grasp enzyme